MAQNRGKQFEYIVRTCFQKVLNTCIVRLPDQTAGFKGARNVCDFIVYHYPYQYFIECKTVHGNTLPFTNITDNQWNGLLEVSRVRGVKAGILCWWVDKDVTKWIPIEELQKLRRRSEQKSLRYDADIPSLLINGKKKKVFYEYDMEDFFKHV